MTRRAIRSIIDSKSVQQTGLNTREGTDRLDDIAMMLLVITFFGGEGAVVDGTIKSRPCLEDRSGGRRSNMDTVKGKVQYGGLQKLVRHLKVSNIYSIVSANDTMMNVYGSSKQMGVCRRRLTGPAGTKLGSKAPLPLAPGSGAGRRASKSM